ncbi:unnamed protein product [Cuscuta epithymum]|uniref:Uncharacterized protein n=1 Tax=Cuscuta epithymum TaxID=186058 RepID=A0AAV0GGF4_9ASTE|nr:unnamed protein product [Cuscuta epithymum]
MIHGKETHASFLVFILFYFLCIFFSFVVSFRHVFLDLKIMTVKDVGSAKFMIYFSYYHYIIILVIISIYFNIVNILNLIFFNQGKSILKARNKWQGVVMKKIL